MDLGYDAHSKNWYDDFYTFILSTIHRFEISTVIVISDVVSFGMPRRVGVSSRICDSSIEGFDNKLLTMRTMRRALIVLVTPQHVLDVASLRAPCN